jgi:hypothetical protein
MPLLDEETPDTPATRIAAAIDGKKRASLVEVRAADVVALSEAVPDDRVTELTLDLAAGAAGAMEGAKNKGAVLVYQIAAQLNELLNAALAAVERKPEPGPDSPNGDAVSEGP